MQEIERDSQIRLADILVDHSIRVQKGDKVFISSSTEAEPLVKEVYRKVLLRGGIPIPYIMFPGLEKIFVDEASKEQITDITFDEWIHRNVDAMIYIRAASNTKELTNVDPEKLMWRQQALAAVIKRYDGRRHSLGHNGVSHQCLGPGSQNVA